jgi:hypothetical protein
MDQVQLRRRERQKAKRRRKEVLLSHAGERIARPKQNSEAKADRNEGPIFF